jgi:hypothetical protein
MEATAIQVIMAGKQVKILVAYLSPSSRLMGAEMTTCFGGELPVFMAGELNAQQVDSNSRMTTRRGKLLRDYADGNSCLLFGRVTPTTKTHSPSIIPDVLDIVLTQNLSFPVYLTSCSALSSDHLPVLIDNACRSSFLHPPDRPDFRRTNWANSKLTWKNKFLSTRNCSKGWQSIRALRISPAPF